jgi:hypothetical protein
MRKQRREENGRGEERRDGRGDEGGRRTKRQVLTQAEDLRRWVKARYEERASDCQWNFPEVKFFFISFIFKKKPKILLSKNNQKFGFQKKKLEFS